MYKYKATINTIYDGDGSFDAVVDLGMNIQIKKKIRLFGVDTPEMRGVQHDAGKIVRDHVRELMLGRDVIISTKYDATGKYGRLLADIEIDGIDLGKHLVDLKYAKPYFGGTKEPWTTEELDYIINAGLDNEL